MRWIFIFAIVAVFLGGCSFKNPSIKLSSQPLHVKEVSWDEASQFAPPETHFFEALKRTCKRIEHIGPYCDMGSFEDLKKHFMLAKIENEGKMTGYYEPILHGSRTKNERYKYPLYAQPEDLLEIELGSLYPELSKYRLRGQIQGNKVVPYPSHKAIDNGEVDAPVLCYVDSKVDAFFLHIQGSGKVILDDGDVLNIGYANQNGHPYRAIGRIMKKRGFLDEVSMQSIRLFLEENPELRDEVLYTNPSYVFFEIKNQGATGAAGVELIPNASVAVDRRFISLGMPLFIKSEKEYISPWVVAQDVGGAIKGETRMDYFFGGGDLAAKRAGELYTPIEVYLILPRGFLMN